MRGRQIRVRHEAVIFSFTSDFKIFIAKKGRVIDIIKK